MTVKTQYEDHPAIVMEMAMLAAEEALKVTGVRPRRHVFYGPVRLSDRLDRYLVATTSGICFKAPSHTRISVTCRPHTAERPTVQVQPPGKFPPRVFVIANRRNAFQSPFTARDIGASCFWGGLGISTCQRQPQ